MKAKPKKKASAITIVDPPKRRLPKSKRTIIERSDEEKKSRVLKISIVDEAYRILNLDKNVRSYKVLKIDRDSMLIAKTVPLEVMRRWNTNPGDMQPGSKLIKKDYCALFILAWHKPRDTIFIELEEMGCPVYKAKTVWEVEEAFKGLEP